MLVSACVNLNEYNFNLPLTLDITDHPAKFIKFYRMQFLNFLKKMK